jgi:LacI family transcriptional regulator
MATIHDVARAAGVSAATVSHVMNGSRHVAPETQARVLAAITELDYRRDGIARSLRRSKTGTIGVIISDIANSHFSAMVRGIENSIQALPEPLNFMLCNTDEDGPRERMYLDLLIEKRVDGLIVAPAGYNEAEFARAAKTLPMVFVDRRLEGVEVDSIGIDNRGAAKKLVTHLINQGHRRIAALSAILHANTISDRMLGYRDALKEAGIPHDPSLEVEAAANYAAGTEAGTQLLRMRPRLDAVFSCSNFMTLGLMQAVSNAGMSCPKDIAAAGFDDFPWAEAFRPRLTVAAQPSTLMAERAVQMLFERINKTRVGPPERVLLDATLVVRESCGAKQA